MWSNNLTGRQKALIDGKIFCGGYVFSAVANAAAVQARIKGGANAALVDVIVTAAGKALVQPYKDTTYTADGTSIPLNNRNLGSSNLATASAFYTPTVNALGTACAPTLVEGAVGTGAGGVRVGAESADDFGFLLPNGHDVLFTITNNSGAASDIGVLFFVSELP